MHLLFRFLRQYQSFTVLPRQTCLTFSSFPSFPDEHFYEPGSRQGHGLRNNPFNSIISPRPIGWISSQGSNGNVNLAPYSFFNCFNYHPPIIGFSSIGWKDTVKNCSETGEFTWNLATKKLGEGVNTSCEPVGPEVNEYEMSGLTEVPSNIVAPPRVGESPVNFECKVTQIEQLRNAQGEEVGTWMILGEVIGVHISKELIRDGVYDSLLAEPLLRGGGPADYYTITRDNVFQIHRRHGHLEDPSIDEKDIPNPL